MEFHLPLHAGDLKLAVDGRFSVASVIDMGNLDTDDALEIFAALENVLDSDVVEACVDNECFDPLYSTITEFAQVGEKVKRKALDLICHVLTAVASSATDACDAKGGRDAARLQLIRKGLKMYTLLLSWLITAASKGQAKANAASKAKAKKTPKKTSSWDWEKLLENKALPCMAQAAEVDLVAVWAPVSDVEEDYLQLLVNTALGVLEDANAAKSAVVRSQVTVLLAEAHSHTSVAGHMTTALSNILHKHEHVPVVVADIIHQVSKVPSHPTGGALCGELLREIGRDLDKANIDNTGAKNIGTFLADIAMRMPREVLANVSMLLPCLGCTEYQLRSGIVTAFASLIMSLDGSSIESAAVTAMENTGSLSNDRTKDSLMDQLFERFEDTNAFTRAKVCQAWTALAREGAIPQERLADVVDMAFQRATDKTSVVRKSALQLVVELMEHNPFKDCLNSKVRAAQYKALKENREATAGEDEHAVDDEDNVDNLPPAEKFAADAFFFSDAMEKGMNKLGDLLLSTIASDVLEVLQVFTTARQFRICGAEEMLLKALSLVWSNNASISDALIDSYHSLYLDPNRFEYAESKGKLRVYSLAVARQLIKLLDSVDLGQLTSMERLMSAFVERDMLPKSVVDALWGLAAMKAPESTLNESVQALALITHAAAVSPEMVRSNVQVLTLAAEKEEHLLRLRWVFAALQCLNESPALRKAKAAKGAKGALNKIKLVSSHPMFDRMVEICTMSPASEQASLWYAAAEQAVNAIYAISNDPQCLVKRILHALTNDDDTTAAATPLPCSSQLRLSQLLFVSGHVALKQLVHMENAAAGVRRENMKKEKKTTKSDVEEMGAGTAQLEQSLEDMLSNAENDLVKGETLLGKIVPIVHAVAINDAGVYTDVTLRASAVLTLAKFMCVDSGFCEENLRLLFSLLRQDKSPIVRTNVIVALGDLAFRFPNEVEPWWPSLYECLRDADVCVRRHAVLVMSHLILNDMVKAKGPMSELAICTQDSDARVSGAATLFFQELARKGSAAPIYNHLPDVLSKLSASEEVDGKMFQSILSFLLSFISKDKQADALMDKLCNRLQTTNDPSQWRDVTYCISQIKISEKGFKKLMECFKTYADKLWDDAVFVCLNGVGEKQKKTAAGDAKSVAEEFLARLDAAREQALEDHKTSKKASKLASKEQKTQEGENGAPADVVEESASTVSAVQKKAAKVASRAAPKKRVYKKVVAESESEEEEDDDDSLLDSEDEDSEFDEDNTNRCQPSLVPEDKENTPNKTVGVGGKVRGGRRTRVAVVDDDSEEE